MQQTDLIFSETFCFCMFYHPHQEINIDFSIIMTFYCQCFLITAIVMERVRTK